MSSDIGVGLIGVSASGGWSRESHVPAVLGLGGLRLAAVGSRSQENADAAAAKFGADRAYGDPLALIADPDVHLVGITAPVPAHRDLIVEAVRLGKHVLTEWPVGVDARQNTEIVDAAGSADTYVAVGLQARANPATAMLRSLLDDSVIGRVLSVTVYSSTAGFGPMVPRSALYLEDPGVGMNLSTIQLAHTLDLVTTLLGPFAKAVAQYTTQYPGLRIEDTGEFLQRVVPDHVLVQGRLSEGAAVAVQVAGGRPAEETPYRMEVQGESGTLALVGGDVRGFQAGRLELQHDGKAVEVPKTELDTLPTPAINVGGVYASLRDDIRQGTTTAPTLADALELSRLLDRLRGGASAG
ncbi:Gfo/Idh/MocA family protein [Streptomyces sp. NPDC094468]|uniref:Gfo/Idh/MocA family protein n=1 Tax=Streptomyces sp. NPDC094468 TaxID=3366066 RepID=UPI003808F451